MKKSIHAILICGLLVMLLTACGKLDVTAELTENTQPEPSQSTSVTSDTTTDDFPVVESQTAGANQVSAVDMSSQLFDENVLNIDYGPSNTLLVLKTDGTYLYDVASGTVEASHSDEQDAGLKWFPLNPGFCAIGIVETESKTGKKYEESVCIFYDEHLQEVDRISLQELCPDADVAVWSVSANGEQIVWSDVIESHLWLYDRSTETLQELLNFNGDHQTEAQGLVMISDVFFDTERQQLIFIGDTMTEQDINGIATWGTIHLDGTELQNHFFENFTAGGESNAFVNSTLFAKESNFKQSGKACLVDTVSGKQKIYQLQSAVENGYRQFLSQGGAYFATSEIDDKRHTLTVRIYSAEDGSIVTKQEIRGNENWFTSSPVICILDDLKTFFVMTPGFDDVPTSTFQYSF